MWVKKEDNLPKAEKDIPVIVWVKSDTYTGWIPSLFSENKFYFQKEDITDIVEFWSIPPSPTDDSQSKVDILC